MNDTIIQCPDCGQPAEDLTCRDCGIEASVIDCGHFPQPAEIAASKHDGQPVCGPCEDKRDADGKCLFQWSNPARRYELLWCSAHEDGWHVATMPDGSELGRIATAEADKMMGSLSIPAPGAMTIEQARAIRDGEAAESRRLTRQTRAQLDADYRAAGHWYDSMTKDELVSARLRESFPLDLVSEAIHVLHHKPGESWSACQWCQAPQTFAEHTATAVDAIARA